MELDKFAYVFQFVVLWELEPAEKFGEHLGSDKIMVVECPTEAVVPPLGHRLRYIMQECRPSEPVSYTHLTLPTILRV